MYTDPIADLLTRIRNAIAAHHTEISVPYSKVKENIVKIIKDRKYIKDYDTEEIDNHKILNIYFFEDQKPLTLKRISCPGQRIYRQSRDIKGLRSGLGITILSTSKGIMTHSEAKKNNLGGEVICEIY